jgi:hypothetical protein
VFKRQKIVKVPEV